MTSSAILSSCRLYRYMLERRWGDGPHVLFIMLNPSTADENTNDRTIEKCMAYAKRWGYSAIRVVNLFAWRATDPKAMITAADPVGPENDKIIKEQAEGAGMVIAAWGAHGKHMGRGEAVLNNLTTVYALHLTKDGAPGHPLYLKGDAALFLMKGRGIITEEVWS